MLYRKGPGMEAKLCFIGHGLMENRSGLLVDARLTRVSGHAERLAALDMIQARADRPVAITLGADKGYDAADFVEELRTMNVRAARGAEHQRPALGDRQADDPASRLRREPAHPQADRGDVRLDQGDRRHAQDQAPRPCPRSIGPSPSLPRPTIWSGCPSSWGRRHERSDDADGLVASSLADGGSSRPIYGIATTSIWVEPANIMFNKNGRGEFAFGVVNATMELEDAPSVSSSSHGPDLTKGTKSQAPDRPNPSTMTAPSKLRYPSTTATMPSSKLTARDFFNNLLELIGNSTPQITTQEKGTFSLASGGLGWVPALCGGELTVTFINPTSPGPLTATYAYTSTDGGKTLSLTYISGTWQGGPLDHFVSTGTIRLEQQ